MDIKVRKQLLVLTFSILLSLALFVLYVLLYPFPHESLQQLQEVFVPWVATRIALYTPYRYWWPLALIIVPGLIFCFWHLFAYLSGVRLQQQEYLDKPSNNDRNSIPLWEYVCIVGLLLFILVNFSYSSFYQYFYNYHHLNYITGPLNDVLNGKYLLVNTWTQYGFLNILFASFVFKHILYFSHANVHFFSMMLGVIEYICIYAIVRIMTKRFIPSLLGVLFVISIHFYGVFPMLFPSELYVWPGGSVWRFFMAMPTALFVLLWLSTEKKKFFFLSQLCVVLSVMWNIESGISLLIADVGLLIIYSFFQKKTFFSQILAITIKMAILIGFFAVVMILYSAYTYVQLHQLPDWSKLYYFTLMFNNGFLQGLHGAPKLNWYYWPVLLYGIVIVALFIKAYLKKGLPLRSLLFLFFLSIYGYGIYRYFVGKQYTSDLAAVIVPAGIIYVYLFWQFFSYVIDRVIFMKHIWIKRSCMVVFFVMIGFFAYQLYRTVYWSGKLWYARYKELNTIYRDPNVNIPQRNHIISLENTAVKTTPLSELQATVAEMKKYSKDNQVAILGYFDHELLMEGEMTNSAPYWYIHATFYTNKEVEDAIRLYKTKPDYLFLDKHLLRSYSTEYVTATLPLGQDVLFTIFEQIRPYYIFERDIGMVYVYRRIR